MGEQDSATDTIVPEGGAPPRGDEAGTPALVGRYLMGLQDDICDALAGDDGEASFEEDVLEGERGGLARPRVLSDGPLFERAAVNFSHTSGARMPDAATTRRPELAGAAFQAASISMIVHPRNPYVPTMHANLRFFQARHPDSGVAAWWFGGGFDLTPYYGFEDDVRHWHAQAREACDVLGPGAHARFKEACDRYFYLSHRKEARGVGGIFFDDLQEPSFERVFAFVRATGDRLMPAYRPIVARRRDIPYGERERTFQSIRRGRYVEFNLIHDRGTLFGLQSGGRVESILASMPPIVRWRYDWQPEPGTPEAELAERFLEPRDWLGEGG